MDTKSVAPHPEVLNARAERALALFRERGHEIERIADEHYLVPSCSGTRFYRVRYGGLEESCSCPDFEHRGQSCKHLLAVGIAHAKRRTRVSSCSGCGRAFRRREMVEVQESLTYLEGDLLCRRCWHASDAVVL